MMTINQNEDEEEEDGGGKGGVLVALVLNGSYSKSLKSL